MDDDPATTVPIAELERVVLDSKGGRYTVAELRARAGVIAPRVVVWRDLPRGTPQMLEVIGGRVEELSTPFDRFGILVDLTDVKDGSTNAEYRKAIPAFFNGLGARAGDRLLRVAVAFQGNLVARTVANFVVARMIDVPISVHKDVPTALAAIHEALERSK